MQDHIANFNVDPNCRPPLPALPSSILIVGSGVFGLSTAFALLTRSRYANTHITILDSRTPVPTSNKPNETTPPHDPPTASLDTSRIIRADYANPAYAALAAEAQELWRAGWGDWPYERDKGVGENITIDGEPGHESGGDERLEDIGLQPGDQEKPTAGHKSAAPRPNVYRQTGLVLTADTDDNDDGRGVKYVRESLANVLHLEATSTPSPNSVPPMHPSADPAKPSKIRTLPSRVSIQRTMTSSAFLFPHPGSTGYLNPHSGWADASSAMASARARVHALGQKRGNLSWVEGEVTSLLFSSTSSLRVEGVRLATGQILAAHLTILAIGAWTPALLPSLGRQLTATGQILAYLQLTPAEQAMLAEMPVLLNMSNGMFVMPPTEEGLLKIARHGHGYRNPVRLEVDEARARDPCLSGADGPTDTADTSSLGERPGKEDIQISVPADDFETLPAEARRAFRAYLAKILPFLVDRPFVKTRLCWYTDTGPGDFLIDWHPRYRGLFVATGGSGHGFKFLPVLGERVVDVLEGSGEDGLGRQLRELWRWKEEGGGEGDGSRGGERGMIWESEMAKG